MSCPAKEGDKADKAVIHSLGLAHEGSSLRIGNVELLGSGEKVSWTQRADALEVTLPSGASCKYAYTLKLTPTAK